MSNSNPASLSPFKAWILLLFHGKAQGPEHSPSQIADLLVRARCETSATEVKQALQMWGELKEREDEKVLVEEHSLLSPPPEKVSECPSVSHTPVDRPHGTSPFLHDGLEAYIELFGLPKGQSYPSHLPSAQERSPRSQMMERFIGSNDDPYMATDIRERRRADVEAPPVEVDSTQRDMNILELDDGMATEPSTTAADGDPRSSPFFDGGGKGEGRDFQYQNTKQHKTRHIVSGRKYRCRQQTPSRTPQPSRGLETPPTEDLFGPDIYIKADGIITLLEDVALPHKDSLSQESNRSKNKRKKAFKGGCKEKGEKQRALQLQRI